MFKRIKQQLESRKFKNFLDKDLKNLPKDLQDVVSAIKSNKPIIPHTREFQLGLKDKLLLMHKEQLSAKKVETVREPSPKKMPKINFFALFQNWNQKSLVRSFAYVCALVIIASVITYPFIPAPSVVSATGRVEGIVEIANNAPFKIVFTQRMNKGSVEKAFSVEPKVTGAFSWDNNVLYFTPEEKLPLGKTYTITIGTGAQSIFFKNLTKEYKETFRIIAPPKVLLLTPAEGSIVGTDARITVMFDRPMKSLTTIDADILAGVKFEIIPQVKGTFKWLGTKSFQFIPEKLLPATSYKVVIPVGINSLEGGKTEEFFETKFTTEESQIVSFFPGNNAGSVGPKELPVVYFNLEMDKNTATDKLELVEYKGPYNDQVVNLFREFRFKQVNNQGPAFSSEYQDPARTIINNDNKDKEYIKWIQSSGNFKKVDASIEYYVEKKPDNVETPLMASKTGLVLKPSSPLALNKIYAIHINKDIMPLNGAIPFNEESYVIFKTAGKPGVYSYTPGDYVKNYKEFSIQVDFTTPVNFDSVKKHIRTEPALEKGKELDIYLENDDQRLIYYYDYQPSTDYKITLMAGIEDRFGQKTDKETTISFKTKRANTDFELLSKGNMSVLNYNYPPVFYIKSTNLNKVKIKFKELTTADLEYFYKDGYLGWEDMPNAPFTEWEKEIQGKQNKKITTKIDFNEELKTVLRPGFYYFEVISDETEDWYGIKNPKNDRQFFTLTNTALTYKAYKDHVLLWATDLKTGNPVSNIDLFVKYQDQIVASGRPNKSGIYEAKIKDSKYTTYQPNYIVFGKRDGGDITFVESNWSDGIDSWQFNIDYSYYGQPNLVYSYTDRPIYRPGHIVYFKGLIRKDSDASFSVPNKEKEIEVSVRDAVDKEIYKQKLPINKNGTYNGALTLSEGAILGQYSITSRLEADAKDPSFNEFYSYFFVEEYRKPEFKLELMSDKKAYINGEKANINVQGDYYFGAPLMNAKYTYAVTSTDYYFDKYEKDWYSFNAEGNLCYFGCQGSSSLVKEGKGELSASGNTKIQLPFEIHDKKASQIYTFELTAVDKNQQTVSERVSIPIHKGEYYIGVKTDSYVGEVGKPITIKLVSVDFNAKEIPSKKITVKIIERTWNTVKKQNVDGSFYYENSFDDKEINSKTTITGEEGKGKIDFTLAKGGSYFAKAISLDERGNEITAETSLYITSGDYIHFGRENNDRIELIADKPEYNIGDTAKILVKSPYNNVKALLTIERAGILEKRVIDIKSNSEVVEIPVIAEFLPNVFVSIVLVKGSGENIVYKRIQLNNLIENLNKQKPVKEAQLRDIEQAISDNNIHNEDDVSRESKNQKLQKEVAVLKEELAKITNDLQVSKIDLDALPAKDLKQEGEDAGIASFKIGYATLYVNAEGKKLGIQLQTSKERYLPKEEVVVKVKTVDANGAPRPAEVSISVVDESVLSLTESNIRDLIKSFYYKRGLGVATADTLVRSIERINVEATKGGKGGGGGFTSSPRGDFKDSAYWNAVVETNDKGEAEVKFKIPDNLTTWQILAIGITNDTLVGNEMKSFKVSKDIMIRPHLPRFLIVGDKITFGVVVQNETSEKLKSQIYVDVKGLDLTSKSSQPIEIEPFTSQLIEWNAVVKSGKEAKFKFLVEQAEKGDEVEITLPVYPFGVAETVALGGLVQDEKGQVEEVQLPSNVDKNIGELKIKIASTLAGSIAEGIESLVDYPYGCTEQTLSKLVPDLIVKQIISLPAFSNKFIDIKDLNKKVEIGLQRIYQFQTPSGGWGLWENSKPGAYLTSYVLFSLNEAKKAGYSVDDNVINRGRDYLNNYLNTFTPEQKKDAHELNSRAYGLYVISEIDQGSDIALNNNLFESKNTLNISAKAYLVMSYNNLLKRQNNETVKTTIYAKINVLTNDILKEQKATARGVQFEDKKLDYWNFDSNKKTTALVLQMLSRTNIKNPLTEKILRNLLAENKWETTQEASTTLFALIDFLKASQELNPSFWGAIEFNNERKEEAFFSKDTLGDMPKVEIPISKLLLDNQTNRIKIVHSDGVGNLYYDINLKYYLPVEIIEARDQGFQVINEYFSLEDEKAVNPLPSLKVGENYKVKTTLLVPDDRYYVIVEDKLPAGLEGINFNLKTSSQVIKLKGEQGKENKNDWNYWDNNFYHFNHTEVRDDRVSFFADFLPKGVYELEYYVRATSSGQYHDKPAEALEMYMPEVFGRSEGKILEITK